MKNTITYSGSPWLAGALTLLLAALSSSVYSGTEKGQTQESQTKNQSPASELPKTKHKGKLASPAFKTEWDFGYAPVGYKMVYQAPLQNIGADTLQLLSVISTCECTTPKLGTEILPPGSSTKLTINFDTEKFSGLQSRFVEIHSTDPYAPERVIQFKAVIGGRPPEMAILPSSLLLLGSHAGDSLVVKNYTSEKIPFHVAFIDSTLFALGAEYNHLPPEGYTHFYLQVKDSIPAGKYYSTLTIEFETSPPARISMPVKLIRR